GGGNKDPQPYKTQVMAEQDAELETIYPVTIKGKEDIEIRPRIDGFIDAIYVDEGSVVKKGQALFLINSPSATQALTTAQAAVESAKAQVNTAQVNVDRIKPLAEKGIVSHTQLNMYDNSLLSAKATLAQAQAQLSNAVATVGWTKVSSPVDGVVGAISYRQGSLVNSANVLTTVANTSNVFAYFSLNEKALTEFLSNLEGKTQAEKIKNAPEITLTLADGTVYPEKGKLETITGVVNITTGSANFRAEFPNAQGHLRSGTSGKISIPRTLHNVFVIPQEATFAQQDKTLVYKVQGDSVVQKTITAYSTPDGKSYAVTEGLVAGDRIVLAGVATLSNGTKIIAQ
ncbi:efflux RND transporter periplasmic adaptor subunit, partial [Dysgonomonas sp. Marseille-P4677]|uniref:efflux RND transporter periplasmic adaptor subunit n=1 Tax=Dysgonomonas sp. Marseille-P4677 TaxID=2364790 RepID=UPI001913C336